MAKTPRAPQVVTAERWLATLADPGARLDLPQFGCSRCHERWMVMPRAIPEHLIYLVVESTLHGRIGGRRLRLGPGDWCWVMPWVMHEFWLPADGPQPVIHHVKLVLSQAGKGAQVRLRQDTVMASAASTLGPLLDEAAREAGSAEQFAGPRLRAALTLALSGALRLAGRRGANGGSGVVFNSGQRERLAGHARAHRDGRLAPADLAALLDMNADYFTRVFRRSYGVAPRTWLMRERMQAAAVRLRDGDAAIAEIARELGHPDVFLFSRQFKQVFGCSPTAFRRAQ